MGVPGYLVASSVIAVLVPNGWCADLQPVQAFVYASRERTC